MRSRRFSLPVVLLLISFGYLAGRAQSQSAPAARPELPAERVKGIGGVFLKAQDPRKLAAWYRDNLGFQVRGGMVDFISREQDKPEESAHTLWRLFPTNTTYFGGSTAPVMLNYRVASLERMLAQLRSKGVTIEKTEDSDYGRFAWATDPEGNRMELWEPKAK